MLEYYIIITSMIGVAGLLAIPCSMDRTDNFIGSVIVGLSFGWLIWPFVIWALIKIYYEKTIS